MNFEVENFMTTNKQIGGHEIQNGCLTELDDTSSDLSNKSSSDAYESGSEIDYNPDVDARVLAMIFWNANLMERIISYIPMVKDRLNIERCCRRMRDLSRHAFYLKSDVDCNLLDMHFQRTKPEITVAFSGNELVIPVTVASYRLSNIEGPGVQPSASMEKLRSFLQRFRKQVQSLRIGSIHDIQRRMSYINDYELVLTLDLCDELATLRNLRSLCLRNCHMTCEVLDQWSCSDSVLMRQIQSFCFHGIWFDKAADCDRLMKMLKYNVRRLHLSKCGTEVLCQLADRVMHLGIKLDYVYVLLNIHSVNRDHLTRHALEQLSGVCRELQLCICLSTLETNQERLSLNRVLRYVVEFPKITVLELDIGVPETRCFEHYERFFRGLRNLPNLRTLRISSIALRNYQLPLWREMMCGIMYLETITELSIRGIGSKLAPKEIGNLCEFLPRNLKILNLFLARRFKGQHLRDIADRCNKLEVLLILGAAEIDTESVFYAIENLHHLQSIALSSTGEISRDIVNMLLTKEATPCLDAVSFGRLSQPPFSRNMLALLKHRFHYIRSAHNFFCEEKLNEGIETTHLYRSQSGFQRILDGMTFGECPGCEKDLTLFDEES